MAHALTWLVCAVQPRSVSFERPWIELSQLIEPAMPRVEDFLKVHDVDGDLLIERLVKLDLVQRVRTLGNVFHLLILDHFWDEKVEMMLLYVQRTEDDLPDFVDQLVCIVPLELLRVLQEGCRSVDCRYHEGALRVFTEVSTLQGHLNQHLRHLRNLLKEEHRLRDELLALAVDCSEVMLELLLYFVHVCLIEVKMRREIDVKLEELQELPLHDHDLLLRNGTMSDPFSDYLGVQWVHVFEFGGEVERDDAH